LLNIFEGEGGGGVAGDDEEFCTLFVEKPGARDSVAGDGLTRLGAVGETGGVAEVDVVGAGDEGKQSTEDGEAAEAGVEDADGGWGLRSQLSVLRSQLLDRCPFTVGFRLAA
jgi:hypothetical protein